ncbi:MAG: globin-coupled sensor protein [Ancalomicrobiaceae bacterium]|nr:globin-coupled sensor protein [Ancalomicrobiaceae bacterium]
MTELGRSDKDSGVAEFDFFGLDAGQIEVLRANKDYVLSILPDALDGFYAHVSQSGEARRFFRDAAHMAHAKEAQVRHWSAIAEGRFDAGYKASVTRIGEAHRKIGLDLKWYVGGYSYLLSTLIGRINKDMTGGLFRGGKAVRRTALMQALTQAALVDMHFAIGVYVEAGVRDRRSAIDGIAQSFEASIGSISGEVGSAAGAIASIVAELGAVSHVAEQRALSVTHGSEEASTNVQSVAAATEELLSSIHEISRQAAEASRAADLAATDVANTSRQIADLSHAAQKIGDVVELINSIAGQTNLLALNATIEAARAGEAGRGFAVVAAEVKQLADQTAKATSTIAEQVNGIQSSTEDAVSAVEQISTVVASLTRIAAAIASAVEEQGAATQEISASIQRAADGTTMIAGNIVEVSRANTSVATTTNQLTSSAEALNSIVGRMRGEMQTFLGSIRQA